MRIRSVILLLIVMIFSTVIFANDLNKITDGLIDVYYSSTDESELLPVIIVLEQRYDPEKLYKEAKQLSKEERRFYTINTLKSFAEDNRSSIDYLLANLEAESKVSDIRSLWITNVIGLKASRSAIRELNNHPDASVIDYDPKVYLLNDTVFDGQTYIDSNDYNEDNRLEYNERASGSELRNAAYQVYHLNSQPAWDLGYTGKGVTVAVLDTGVNYNHEDIRNQMWEHPEFYAHGYNFVEDNYDTLDRHGHGTHCAGIVAGNGASGTLTGIAPEATIMALKVLGDSGGGTRTGFWAAHEFAIEYGADILSISLGWVRVSDNLRSQFRDVAENVLSAGLIIAKSAGNRGMSMDDYPIPHNVTVPADCPPPWLPPDQTLRGGVSSVVSVAATDLSRSIAGFSSRGPSTWGQVNGYEDYPYDPEIGLIKPDISAPGQNVNSLNLSSNGYTQMSGTSMAAPGIAGVMALVLSKNRYLPPENLFEVIDRTANPGFGYQVKNNTYGAGIANALAAVEATSHILVDNVIFGDYEDSIPEYNQSIDITLTLRNIGIPESYEIIATLSTDNQYVQIIDDTASFGTMEIGSTTTVVDGYTIQIADNIPDAHIVEFLVNASIDGERITETHFQMRVKAPYLSSNEVFVYDPSPQGNDDGFINPGEDIILYVPITNIGGVDAYPATVYIYSESNSITINDQSITHIHGLTIGEAIYPNLSISVSSYAVSGNMVNLYYEYESANYLFSGRIPIMIGSSKPVRLGSGVMVNEPESPAPINISFKSLRSQTVYTAQELYEAGVSSARTITQIGYYIESPPLYNLPNFTVRMRHTTEENAANHLDGPFEAVFQTNQYAPQAGDWDMLSLDTPFIWNGEDNILIDTAFFRTTNWHNSGSLRVYESVDGMRFVREDNLDQTNRRTTSKVNYKPQIMMTFDYSSEVIGDRPTDLAAEQSGFDVILSWQAPSENEERGDDVNNSRNRRAHEVQRISIGVLKLRNPDGYNVYRNGMLLNEELVEDTQYVDSGFDPQETYYYLVRAVYGEIESEPSNIVTMNFRVAVPEFSVTEEKNYEPFLLFMESDTPQTYIYYTLDSSIPSTEDILYQEPIEIVSKTTVTAIAFKEGWDESEMVQQDYQVFYPPNNLNGESKVNAVMLSWGEVWQPEEQRQSLSRVRVLERKGGLSIRNLIGYNVYRAHSGDDFHILNDETLTETLYEDRSLTDGTLSYYVTAVYEDGESMPTGTVILNGTVARPQFSEVPGYYEYGVHISLSSSTRSADIYYTLDGSLPDQSSLLYIAGEPIEIFETTTIKSYAVRDGWKDSEVVEGIFTVLSADDSLPTVYETKLMGAYPNPFNPETTIVFTLKEADQVTVEVFDIKGRKIKTLINDNLDRGRHQVVWHGEDLNGRKLGSGIYFYRLRTSDYSNIRKVLMLK